MATEMTDLVAAEWKRVQERTTAMHNAFGYVDDPDDVEWSADTWAQAAYAAEEVAASAAVLAAASRRIAREREERSESQ